MKHHLFRNYYKKKISIHHRNLQLLATEMFKVINGLAPHFMKEIFGLNDNLLYNNVSSNTRSESKFYNKENPKKVNMGLEILRSLSPKIWEIIPSDLKNTNTLSAFRTEIKRWTPQNCPCRLCKIYVPRLGFL